MINRPPWRPLAAQQIAAAFTGLLLVTHVAAGPVGSFENVEYWVGAGSNRAAVAIDWDKNSTATPALVYNPAVLKALRVSTGSFVRVPGSWRDFL